MFNLAVFYCAGHGFIFNNQHYLIPWDARQGTDLSESLCIETVEAKIQRKNPKVLMMFLDICRKRQVALCINVYVAGMGTLQIFLQEGENAMFTVKFLARV